MPLCRDSSIDINLNPNPYRQWRVYPLGQHIALHFNLSAASYSVSNLNIVQRRYSFEFPQPSCAPDVTDILANLTLPCLENLTLRSDYLSPLPRPHADFLTLSSRSSFYTHLRSLNISDFSIGAAELAQCLSALPLVQRLEISDDHRDGVEPIIKDSLLSSLTRQPDLQALLPHLRHLVFATI
ncbi:hypothetical protein FB451DRAFT_191262 [Mycena latifolia]|nr:hypothetical protein FB451DRAFT_191262 [Mycena latifolia]